MARDVRTDDFVDLELARRLGAAAGSSPDANLALSSLRSRVVGARRRRTRYTVAALVVGIIGAGSTLAIESRRSMNVAPSDSGPTGSAVPVASTQPATTSSAAAAATTAPSVPGASVVDPTPAPGPDATELTSPTVAAPNDPPADVGSGDRPSATGDSDTVAPAAPVASEPQTVTSAGGSIRVDVRDQQLALTAVQPAEGRHVAQQEVGPDRIVVTFASMRLWSTITAVLIDGRVHAEVREGDGRDSGWDDGDHRDGRDGGWDGGGSGSAGDGGDCGRCGDDHDGGWDSGSDPGGDPGWDGGGDPDGGWDGGSGGDGGWSGGTVDGRDGSGWEGGSGGWQGGAGRDGSPDGPG